MDDVQQPLPDHYLWCRVCNCYHDHVQAKSTACSNVNVTYYEHCFGELVMGFIPLPTSYYDDIDLTP